MRTPQIEVRRAADRFRTRTGWLDSWRSFSFEEHYDPANTGHGLLVAHNEETLQPGTGFDLHRHRDTEIVTWVLEGTLLHEDSAGHRGVIRPGLAQRMSAGRGILHSERASDRSPVRYVQMWLAPDEAGVEPGYEQRDVSDLLVDDRLVPLATGDPGRGAAVSIRNRAATFHVARLAPGRSVELPDAPYLHLFVSRGVVSVEGVGRLAVGDAVRLTGGGGQRVSGEDRGAEVLAWEMHASTR